MRTTARLGAYAASAALVMTGINLAGAPATAAGYDTTAVDTASSWIAGQTENGLLVSGYLDNFTDPDNPVWKTYPDAGLTIDAIESLVEAGEQPAAVQSMTNAVEDDTSYPSNGPGAQAKLLTVADTTGRDLATFGDGTLVSGVESNVSAASGSVGRLDNAYGSVLSQAYAAHALTAARSSKAPSVVDYLLRQQCTGGFFREGYDTGSAGSSGDDCIDGTSAGSIDATATAVLQLRKDQDADVQAALTRARTWLASQQQADGSWLSFGAGNANSTGLAARALGEGSASSKAAAWLRAHQITSSDAAPLDQDAGAIALDDTGYGNARDFGIGERDRPAFVRATAQSLAATRWLQGGLSLSAPTSYLRARTPATFTVAGTRTGEQLTLTGPGTSQTGAATGSSWSRTVQLPAGTGTRTYTVSDADGHSAARSVAVLDATKLGVSRPKYRVKKGRFTTVTIRGLAAGERTVISYKGKVVRTTTATRDGLAWARFRVGHVKGVKTVTAVGQFSDIRRGNTTIKVVR